MRVKHHAINDLAGIVNLNQLGRNIRAEATTELSPTQSQDLEGFDHMSNTMKTESCERCAAQLEVGQIGYCDSCQDTLRPKTGNVSDDEKEKLAAAVRKTVAGLVEIWDALLEIGNNHNADFEPESVSCTMIVEQVAENISTPEEAMTIELNKIIDLFTRPEDWHVSKAV
jgi:hypothetical protein